MTDIVERIEAMQAIDLLTTKGSVKIDVPMVMSSRDYPDYRVKLEYDGRILSPGWRLKPSEKPGRGEIAVFPGGQSHHYSSDDERISNGLAPGPGFVRTSQSWSTRNETAEADVKLFVVMWNNREELFRLAKIGAAVEEATRQDA